MSEQPEQAKRIGIKAPLVEPLADQQVRPFWSVMVPVYNPQPDFLECVLTSVLDQGLDAGDVQIEIVDDYSTESDPRQVQQIFQEGGVGYYRQPTHSGIAGNWNTCIERARGRWVHILHQDDLLLPGFYGSLRAGIEKDPLVAAAYCRDGVIDGQGRVKNLQPLERSTPGRLTTWLEHIFVSLRVRASSVVVRRSVYETLGGFDVSYRYALDWDMWKRISVNYPIWYEPEPLVFYRRHRSSASNGFIQTGEDIREIARSIEEAATYLAPHVSGQVTRKARENYTLGAIRSASDLYFDENNLRASIVQIREARRLSSSLTVFRALALFVLRAVRSRVRGR